MVMANARIRAGKGNTALILTTVSNTKTAVKIAENYIFGTNLSCAINIMEAEQKNYGDIQFDSLSCSLPSFVLV